MQLLRQKGVARSGRCPGTRSAATLVGGTRNSGCVVYLTHSPVISQFETVLIYPCGKAWNGPPFPSRFIVSDPGHNLPDLADAAGVTVSPSERSILARLTDFIVYAGRYPISKQVKDMEPSQNTRRAHGRT